MKAALDPTIDRVPDINPLNTSERLLWYRENLRIRPKKQPGQRGKSRLIPFEPNNIQEELEDYVVWCYANKIPPRVLVLKARQEGVSTWTEGHIFLQTRLFPDQQAFIVAHDEEATQNLRQMYLRYYQNMPPELDLQLDASNKRGLSFKDNRSEIFCFTAGKGAGGGRSFNPTHLHASEVDFWPYPERLFDAMAQGIADEPWTLIVFESTADGPGLMMNSMWDDAIRGRNEYKPFFFGWHRLPEYQRPPSLEDLRRYGPDDWVSKNGLLLERMQEELAHVRLARHVKSTNRPGSFGGDGGAGTLLRPAAPAGGAAGAEPSGPQRAGGAEPDRLPGDTGAGPWRPTRSVSPTFQFDLERGCVPVGGGGGGTAAPTDNGGADHLGGDGATGSPGPDLPDGPRPSPEYRYGAVEPVGALTGIRPGLDTLFRDSFTPYEIRLVTELELSLGQINWLRWVKRNKCRSVETTRRREYPSFPEESFQASASEVLDLRVLSEWKEDAERWPKQICSLLGSENSEGKVIVTPNFRDEFGRIDIYEFPHPKRRYCAFLDPAQGVGEHEPDKMDDEGDWHVLWMMDLESGDQVAEYRSKDDPDLMTDQIEYLCLLYHTEELAIETTGGYGIHPQRILLERGTLKLHFREHYNKRTRERTKTPGWATTTATRPAMVAEGQNAVRERRCTMRSVRSIREAMTLEEKNGKVQARKNHHDDGPMAYFGCLIIRNRLLGKDRVEEESLRKDRSHIARLNRAVDRQGPVTNTIRAMGIKAPFPTRAVRSGKKKRVDGRRGAF